jgi:hypothetical protein
MLEQNPADLMVDALIFFINNTANGTHTPYPRASFSPPTHAVSVNCLFFASLSASIVAALASVVSLQWVAEYDAAVSRSGSSPEDRVKRRQFRYSGMEKWKMREIIAALPILLYFSLVLFFIGLAQWMWSVHTTIGGVVLGGMLLGTVFYAVTTLLSVVFPSSPYRAPIVRWIYVLIHIILRPFTKILSAFGKSSSEKALATPRNTPLSEAILAGLTRMKGMISKVKNFILYIPSRFDSSTIQGRDQAHIGSIQKDLISDSLSWLAQNISISRDSRQRLLLLAHEASKLDEEQQSSRKFQEIPWSEIFRLLGTEYAQRAIEGILTEEDEKGIAVLLRCLHNKHLEPMISPVKKEENIHSTPEAHLQNVSEDQIPNPTYLLLRNIDLQGRALSIEQQVRLRVGCLNQAHYVRKNTQGDESFHRELISRGTEDICDYLIPALAADLGSRAHDDAQDRINNLICLTHLKQPILSDLPFVTRTWWGWQETILHPSPLVYRLHCANWVTHQIEHPYIHTILKALFESQVRKANLSLLWEFVATDKEVEDALALASAEDRGRLSGRIKSRREDPYLVETLKAFDKLISRGCQGDQRSIIIGLVCIYLQGKGVVIQPGSLSEEHRETIQNLKDPWIRLIGLISVGIYAELDDLFIDLTKMSAKVLGPFSAYLFDKSISSKEPTIQRLKMRLWNHLDITKTDDQMQNAMKDLEILVSLSLPQLYFWSDIVQKRLESEFTQTRLGMDYGGDFLLQIIHSPFGVIQSEHAMGTSGSHGIVPAILASKDVEAYVKREAFKPDSALHLKELSDEVKRSPGRLARLLIHIVAADFKYFRERNVTFQCALDIYQVIGIVKEYCLDVDMRSYISYVHNLARLLAQSRDLVLEGWEVLLLRDENTIEQLGDKGDFSVTCTQVIHSLLTPRLSTFGIHASRSLCCARPIIEDDAARGWLGMYEGERYRPNSKALVW